MAPTVKKAKPTPIHIRPVICRKRIHAFSAKVSSVLRNIFSFNYEQWIVDHDKTGSEMLAPSKPSTKTIFLQVLKQLNNVKNIEQNYFIFRVTRGSAFYEAGKLWIWKINNKNNNFCQEFVLILSRSINLMEERDVFILRKMLLVKFGRYFSDLVPEDDTEIVKHILLAKLYETNEYVKFIVEIVHQWYLRLPLLTELGKYLTWEYLLENDVFLLSVDDLYSLLIENTYKLL